MNTTQKGDISLGKVTAALLSKGYAVSLPLTTNLRYDLIFDDGSSLKRVQCKTAHLSTSKDCLVFNVSSHGWDKKRVSYEGQIEYFGVCFENQVYLVPPNGAKSNVYLRLLSPKKNTGSRPMRFAKDFEIGV